MIKNILKGMLIGIANILPGVSGGTLAVSMGIYDKLIHCVTHIQKEFRESVKFLMPVFAGAGISLVCLSFLIEAMFERYPVLTNFLFIGMIIGGLPAIAKHLQRQRIRAGHIVTAVLFFMLVTGTAALGRRTGATVVLDIDFIQMIKLFAIGILAAATMVIPGVSGSMILLVLGYYGPIISEINSFFTALMKMDIAGLLHSFAILFPFGMGVIAGILVIAGIIEYVFDKFPAYAYWGITGLILASPFAILLCNHLGEFHPSAVLIAVLSMGIGGILAMLLGES